MMNLQTSMAGPLPFTLPEDATPEIRALHDYWLSIHPAGGGLPGRLDFDPVDIPALLPRIALVDVQRAPLRFRFRLVGTQIVKAAGHDATGQWLDEADPGYPESEAFQWHQSVAESGRPAYRKDAVAERLCLPLAGDGVTVDILLLMTLHRDSKNTTIPRISPVKKSTIFSRK